VSLLHCIDRRFRHFRFHALSYSLHLLWNSSSPSRSGPVASRNTFWTPFTRYNLLSNRLWNPFDNRLNVCMHSTTGCQTRCQTGLATGRTTGCIACTYCTNIQPVVKPIWQPVVSCKRGIRITRRRRLAHIKFVVGYIFESVSSEIRAHTAWREKSGNLLNVIFVWPLFNCSHGSARSYCQKLGLELRVGARHKIFKEGETRFP